ncbi:TlpA family protein disulfide reductase [Dysgonomonas reticulitermitis]
MYKIIRLFSILLLFPAISLAQSVSIRLPWYAGRDYYFCLLEGAKQDTIARGELDAGGRASVTLPRNYRGVGRFSVREYGRIWNIVINGNEQSGLSEPDAMVAETTFDGSPENNYLLNTLARQNKIIKEYAEVSSRRQNQSPSYVLAPPEQRMQVLDNEYKAFRKEINDSPLYAARIVEILNCLSGTGSSFNVPPDGILEEQREFIARMVDFNDLYTSGFWQQVLETWVQTSTNDSLLLSDTRHMIDRCGNDIHIRREVTQAIIRLFIKYAKDSLLAELGTEYLTMPLNGQPAPEIVAGDSSIVPKLSLIVFYETGCGNCHYELEELKSKYKLLTDNNIRVISIAADADRAVFEETATGLPWADKLCDFKGFDGANFRNYGIVGTPTFILTDGDGIVRGRYAQLKELLKE